MPLQQILSGSFVTSGQSRILTPRRALLSFRFGSVRPERTRAGTVPLTTTPVAVLGPRLLTVAMKASLPPTCGRFGFGLIFGRSYPGC